MRTCCLKLQQVGSQAARSSLDNSSASGRRLLARGDDSCSILLYSIWLLASAGKAPLHSSQSISNVHPKIHSALSKDLSKLLDKKDGVHCFPDIISWHDDTTGTSFLDFLSPRGFQPNISRFLKNCWQQEGSITGSTRWVCFFSLPLTKYMDKFFNLSATIPFFLKREIIACLYLREILEESTEIRQICRVWRSRAMFKS